MSPARLQLRVITSRAALIRDMLQGLRALPLDDYSDFSSDPRNAAAADSYLRRALEALLDLGRHFLAKAFGQAVPEYKQIPKGLVDWGVLGESGGSLLRQMAGHRNRLVHLYDQVSDRELYETCSSRLVDIEAVLAEMLAQLERHPRQVDSQL